MGPGVQTQYRRHACRLEPHADGGPVAHEEARRIYGERSDLAICSHAEEALDGADALAVVTEWIEFRSPDFDEIREKLTHPVIFDGRNIYDPQAVTAAGLTHHSIGRQPAMPT